jgi:selenocysteine lyase/cysteine desulfurase
VVGSSNTQIWHTAFTGIELNSGDRILVGETEWGGNLSAIQHLCLRTGAIMQVVPSDENGAINVTALRDMLDDDVRLVCVTWVPAINGLVNDVDAIAEALSDSDAWLFVDAAQSFGQITTDLSNPRFDVVTVSARKYLRAPRGTGFGVFSERFLAGVDPIGIDQSSGPWSDGGPKLRPDARRFEYGETSFAVRLGLEAAVSDALELNWIEISHSILALADYARQRLSDIQGIEVQDKGDQVSGIVTFSVTGLNPSDIIASLHKEQINLSSPGEPYGPLWFAAGRPQIVRMSPYSFNTRAEIDKTVAILTTLAAQAKS